MSDIAIGVDGLKLYRLGAASPLGCGLIAAVVLLIGDLAYSRRMESTFADVA